ncbi:unnamed protein product [Parnassius mnemosyne]|uniref:Uncharacterized protein n=1 Tax=Parnassius mnemosyne TaxID=213953 RepID=A0AAV1KRX4_9NEOP
MNNKSGLASTDFATNAIAKLRRLKIQESVLNSSVHKVFSTPHEHEEFRTTFKGNNELKQYLNTIKNSFIEIKNLLEDVKISTNSSETIGQLDINEVKRDVLNLEAKLTSFKSFLQKEIATLKFHFNEIQGELKGKRFEDHKKNYKPNKQTTKQYTEIVPSPVRVLINSPFKCPEVENFQAFIMNSQRYGGWNEYNHNIFVQIWNKHFHMDNVDVLINVCNSDENIDRIQSFNEEVLQKIPGTTLKDIISHNKWYSEYVYLKSCQQRALEKWKDNKRKIKKTCQQQNAKHDLQSNRLSMSSGTAKSLMKKRDINKGT